EVSRETDDVAFRETGQARQLPAAGPVASCTEELLDVLADRVAAQQSAAPGPQVRVQPVLGAQRRDRAGDDGLQPMTRPGEGHSASASELQEEAVEASQQRQLSEEAAQCFVGQRGFLAG